MQDQTMNISVLSKEKVHVDADLSKNALKRWSGLDQVEFLQIGDDRRKD